MSRLSFRSRVKAAWSRSSHTGAPPAGTTRKSALRSTRGNHLEPLEDRAMLAVMVPDGFENSTYVAGLSLATSMEFAPDGRLFIAEKTGQVRIVENGVLLPEPFLTVVPDTRAENGLGAIAFDKDYATNGYFYVYYTADDNGTIKTRVSRFSVSTNNPNMADPQSEVVLVDGIGTPDGYHNGGAMHFAADGMLYIGIGDGAQAHLAQDLGSLNGKVLRINPTAENIIPHDNPFVGVPGARPEIYALGFRNPFTFNTHPDGRIYINDVGLITAEEINLLVAGGNYGWPAAEGAVNDPLFMDPLYSYAHDENGAAAIAGSVFYTGTEFPPEYQDNYFFMDFVFGTLDRLHLDEHGAVHVESFATGIFTPVDLDLGPDGSLYYLTAFGGTVGKISFVGDTNRRPIANGTADIQHGTGPLLVHFTAAGSYDPDNDTLIYEWDFGDGSPPAYGLEVTHTYTSSGIFLARVTVRDPEGAESTSQEIKIAVDETPPVASINITAPHVYYQGGDVIYFSGTASDLEDGVLPASAYRWTIQLHHNDIVHPGLGPLVGVTEGVFQVAERNAPAARPGEVPATLWYRITLTVTDSSGLEHTTFVDIHPQLAEVTLTTNVTGLGLDLDGGFVPGGGTFTAVAGIRRTIGAPAIQTLGTKTYVFERWEHGGDQVQEIRSPATDTVYRAIYREAASEELASLHFVAGLYEDILRRSGEPTGLSGWIEALRSGASRSEIVLAFWNSAEHHTLQIQDMYVRAFQRPPHEHELLLWLDRFSAGDDSTDLAHELFTSQTFFDLGGRNSPQGFVNTLHSLFNVTRNQANTARWTELLTASTANRPLVLNEFFASAEYLDQSLTTWHRKLFGKLPTETQLADWQLQINSGGYDLTAVVRGIFESRAYLNHRVSGSVIIALYDNLLNRAPSVEELQAWTQQLQAGLTPEALVSTIYNSPERGRLFIKQTYTRLLERLPSSNEITKWLDQLETGVSEHEFLQAVVTSPEYVSQYAEHADYVASLFRKLLRRSADLPSLQFLTGQLVTEADRGQIAGQILNSPERLTLEIQTRFQSLLNRPASSEELEFVQQEVERSGIDVTLPQLTIGLATSEHYFTFGFAQGSGIDGAETHQFIVSLYSNLLRRSPSEGELQHWLEIVGLGMYRHDVAANFVDSAEYLNLLITDTYQDIFGRSPADEEAQQAFEVVSQNRTGLIEELLASSEFSTLYADNLDFLQGVYQEAFARSLDGLGQAYWLPLLEQGSSRADLVGQILATEDYWQQVIHDEYQSLLQRPADSLGLNYWLPHLTAGNKTVHDLTISLLASDEFYG